MVGKALSELLVRLPESEIVAEEEDAGLWMPRRANRGIKVKRLAPELRIARSVRGVRGAAAQREKCEECDDSH
jgi:hypothetical protein